MLLAMAARLATDDGITAYRQRGHIAETPHGDIKHNMRFRQLSLRGKRKAAAAQWKFTCAVRNLSPHRHQQRPPHPPRPRRPRRPRPASHLRAGPSGPAACPPGPGSGSYSAPANPCPAVNQAAAAQSRPLRFRDSPQGNDDVMR